MDPYTGSRRQAVRRHRFRVRLRPGTPGGPSAGQLVRHALLALGALATVTCENDIATPPDRNASPRLAFVIPPQSVPDSVVVDLLRHFVDPDGDSLAFTATSSNTASVWVDLDDAVLTLVAVRKGSATVSVSAADPDGETATYSFPATVPNRAPRVVRALSDVEALTGDEVSTRVGGFFTDADGDPLTFSAQSSVRGVATVEVAGDEVAVRAIAPGAAAIAVTATDPEGLAATQSFMFTVPNRSPAATAPLLDIEVLAGETATARLSDHFTDPDGEELVYTAESSEGAVADVLVATGELTVSAVAKGSATVTVTATDPGGLAAVQSFSVTVPNRPPRVVDTPSDIEVQVGEEVGVAVAVYFADPDGDELAFVSQSSDTGRVVAATVGGTAQVRAISKGTATVAVTATDPEGLAASVTFLVVIPNRAPEAGELIADVEIAVDDSVRTDLSRHFADPDGDELVFAAESSDEDVVRATVTGRHITVDGIGKGTATILVTATDTEGLVATQSFGVMVPNRAPHATGTVPPLELVVMGESVTTMSHHFADPDGDVLTFGAESSDTMVALASVAGDRVTVRAVAVGTATITVSAADSSGLAATQAFQVTVRNRGPVVEKPIPGRQLEVGAEFTTDLEDHVADPDGEPLAFAVASSHPEVATARTSGSELEVRGLARGVATITVTATDPHGASVELGFNVRVPNRAPRNRRTLKNIVLDRGAPLSIDVAPYFADPDEDALSFAAKSSDTSLVSVEVTGSHVRLKGIAEGRATITVTATDPDNLSASQSFEAAVIRRNRPPQATRTIPDQSLEPGDEVTSEAADHFADPDGDELTFTASSSDATVALATISDNRFTTTALETGSASVTVTATDPAGLSVAQEFTVEVDETPTNGAPRPVGYIVDRSLHAGERFTVDASDYFTDPDGEPLTFAATSSRAGVAAVSTSGNDVTVDAISAGRATVTVTATDPGGLSATQTFVVLVRQRGQVGDFDIELVFTDSVPTTYRSSLTAAATRWMSIVGNTEWADVALGGTKTCRDVEVDLDVVDDLVIVVDAVEMDGELGTAARAGVCMAREGSDGYAPILGYVRFDKVDLGILEQHGDLVEIMVHEITHVLGFGYRWVQLGLLDQGSDPHFSGVRAIEAFDSAGGVDYSGAKVPTQPGQGHWRESVLGSELMTPNLFVNRREPLSRVTLGAMADMGYHVDFSLADDYEVDGTQSDAGAMNREPVISMAGDFEWGPVEILDRRGRVVRIIPGR